MKIKQTDEHNKPEKKSKSEKAVQGKSMVGKTCEKGRFWGESEKEKELRRIEMMMMYMNCHEWNAVNVKETD